MFQLDKDNMIDIVEIYTDGACRGNPVPGGWEVGHQGVSQLDMSCGEK